MLFLVCCSWFVVLGLLFLVCEWNWGYFSLLEPRTPNPEPRTPNPEPRTPNPEPPNPEPRTPNPEPRTPNPPVTARVQRVVWVAGVPVPVARAQVLDGDTSAADFIQQELDTGVVDRDVRIIAEVDVEAVIAGRKGV